MSRTQDIAKAERRRFLGAALAGGALVAVGGPLLVPRLFARDAGGAMAAPATPGQLVYVECFADDDGHDLGRCEQPKLILTDAQWRDRLTPLAYQVMRHAGTERAFSGAHDKPRQPGLYRCQGCDTALYDASTMFHSGTGWPSFWRPIAPANVEGLRDSTWGMTRTAIACSGCDSHLGHKFHDGPPPTGLRYCMNSVALKFVPYAAV